MSGPIGIRELDQPTFARDAGQREVGVEAERERHGVRAAGVHGQIELQAPVDQTRLIVEIVPKRKHLEQLRLRFAPVQPRRQRRRTRSRSTRQLPPHSAPDDAVDRQAVGVCVDPGWILGHPDGVTANRVVEAAQSVGPWIEERNPKCVSALRICVQAGVLGEQLLPTVAQ